MASPRRIIAKTLQVALLAAPRVLARPVSLVLMMLWLQIFAVSPVAKAQHCGRTGYVPEWNQSLMAWESQADVVSDKFETGIGQIRTTECKGPMCSRQQPEPYSTGASGAFFGGPLPWKCNGNLLELPVPEPISILAASGMAKVNNPLLGSLFRPPWVG